MNNNNSFQITFVIMKFLVVSIRKKMIAFSISLLVMISFTACFKNLPKTQIVYQNDFETYNLKGIEVSGWLNGNFGTLNDIKIVTYNNTKVLGRFNNCSADLMLHKLPTHSALHVEFDLYIHDNWKNDLWKMVFDNQVRLMTGFSNDSSIQQSYPNWIGNGSALSPAGSNAYDRELPGACRLANSLHGTSLYKMDIVFLHSDSTFHLNCSDAVKPFNDFCEVSWSMDNLRITTINF